MKNLILALVLLTSTIGAKSQPAFWINNIVTPPGEIVIPVYVSGFDSISSINLGLFCMPPLPYTSNLVYLGTQNVNPALSFPVFNYISNLITDELFVAAFSINCMTIPDSAVLFEMKFNYLGGIGTLIWDTAICVVSKCETGNVPTSFTNGYINTSVGVDHISKSKISAYPNPAGDFLYFNSPVRNFRLYDNLGRLVLSCSNTQKADLSALKSGVYFAEMDETYTKLIKQ